MVLLVRGRVQKTLKKKRKRTEEKHWKMETKENKEYEESQITTIKIFGITFYVKHFILLENIVWKKYLIPSNFIYSFCSDISKDNIYNYTNFPLMLSSHPVEVTGSVYFGNIFQIICLSKIWAKAWKKIGIIQVVSKLKIFVNLWISKLQRGLVCTKKIWNNETLSIFFRVKSLVLLQNIVIVHTFWKTLVKS